MKYLVKLGAGAATALTMALAGFGGVAGASSAHGWQDSGGGKSDRSMSSSWKDESHGDWSSDDESSDDWSEGDDCGQAWRSDQKWDGSWSSDCSDDWSGDYWHNHNMSHMKNQKWSRDSGNWDN